MVATMTEPVALHRRQFVIGPERSNPVADWQHVSLGEECWLSHCPRLPIMRATDQDGKLWILLGLAEQTLSEAPDPAAVISACHTHEVLPASDSWAGRWVLIGDGQLTLDATGLLGCFFRTLPSGATVASCSEVLLPRDPSEKLVVDSRRLVRLRTVAFYPLPSARQQGVSHLLPSQRLDLCSGEALPRRLLPEIPQGGELHSLRDSVLTALSEPIRRIARKADPFWVSLSSGGDSRLILAAALSAGTSPRIFTRVSHRMSAGDFFLPPQIAQHLGLEHEYLLEGDRIPGRWDLVRAQTGGNIARGDVAPLLRGGRDGLDGISIGGHGFGFAKKQRRDVVGSNVNEPLERAREFAAYRGESASSNSVPAIAQWVEWARDHPCPGLDLRDRFYLEQLHAGWQSAKEQAYDMGLHQRFFPLNARRTLALVLALSEACESSTEFRSALIAQENPALLEWPFNPPDESFGRWHTFVTRTKLDPGFPLRRGRALLEYQLERVRLRIKRS